ITFQSTSIDKGQVEKIKSNAKMSQYEEGTQDPENAGLTKIDFYSSPIKLPNGESRIVSLTNSGVSFMKGYWVSDCSKSFIKKDKAKGFLFAGEGWLFQKSTFSESRRFFSLPLETCSEQECTTAQKAIKSRLSEVDKLSKTTLDEDVNVTIKDIYMGDM